MKNKNQKLNKNNKQKTRKNIKSGSKYRSKTQSNNKDKSEFRVDKTESTHKLNNNFKKMNCSPMVKGKTPVNKSCFTTPVLKQIKEEYNQHHPDNIITSTEPTEIWSELKHRFSTCSKEDCWLKVFDNTEIREKMDEYLFAPDQPDEWKNSPNEWLSNFDIMDVLAQYEVTYKNFKVFGPTPIDFDTRPKELNGHCVWEELCIFNLKKYIDSGKTKLGFVFNLDEHNKGGSHWVSMYIDLTDKFIFYMDSAGEKIPKQIDNLVQRIIKQGIELQTPIHLEFYENHPMEHQMGNSECGMYSLYFIITMLTNKTEKRNFTNFIDKINYFKNKRIPDKCMDNFRKIYFNTK